jgi:hypothetical protein
MSKHFLGVKTIFIIYHSRFIGATNGLTEYSDTFEEIEGTDRESVQFPIKECCVALRVSRSGYYQWVGREQSLRAETDAELWKEIQRV